MYFSNSFVEAYHIKLHNSKLPYFSYLCPVILYLLGVGSSFDAHLFWHDMVILLKIIKRSLQKVLKHFFSHLSYLPRRSWGSLKKAVFARENHL